MELIATVPNAKYLANTTDKHLPFKLFYNKKVLKLCRLCPAAWKSWLLLLLFI